MRRGSFSGVDSSRWIRILPGSARVNDKKRRQDSGASYGGPASWTIEHPRHQCRGKALTDMAVWDASSYCLQEGVSRTDDGDSTDIALIHLHPLKGRVCGRHDLLALCRQSGNALLCKYPAGFRSPRTVSKHVSRPGQCPLRATSYSLAPPSIPTLLQSPPSPTPPCWLPSPSRHRPTSHDSPVSLHRAMPDRSNSSALLFLQCHTMSLHHLLNTWGK